MITALPSRPQRDEDDLEAVTGVRRVAGAPPAELDCGEAALGLLLSLLAGAPLATLFGRLERLRCALARDLTGEAAPGALPSAAPFL
jgi:hypothetical protein